MMDDYSDYPAPIRPGVITWFKIYAAMMCLMYLAVTAASLIFFLVDPDELEMQPLEAQVFGVVFLVVGGAFLVACAIPLFVAPRPWVWIYDLVVICLGMTSACTLLFCIPLLIFWLKPETKRYFENG